MLKGQILKYSKNIGRRFFGHVIQSSFTDIYGDRQYLSYCDCGNLFTVRVSDAKRKFSCGCARTKPQLEIMKLRGVTLSPSFELITAKPNCHGIQIHNKKKVRSGYIYLYKPGHPSADQRGYIAEHRLVMEQRIGRILRPEETVHHKNLRRNDNRDINLELWASRHPSGARITDLIEYAIELLKDYDPEKLHPDLKPSIAMENDELEF